MMTPATIQPFGEQNPLDSTMGSMLIGVVASAVLYGITLVQTFYYYRHYPRDNTFMKSIVGVIAFLDSLHLAMVTHTVYHYLVTEYYDKEELGRMTWSVLVEALPTAVTGSIVQCYYAYRLWLLSHGNIPLVATILALVLANTGCGTAWLIMSLQRGTYVRLLEINAITLSINALSAAVDIIIAAVSVYYLRRSKTGFKRSDTLITRLIHFVVNTGLLTSLCAIGSLLSILISPNSLIYASFYFCIGRFYVNSLLTCLNVRSDLRKGDGTNDNTINLSGQVLSSRRPPQDYVRDMQSPSAPHTAMGGRKELAIHIEATTQKEYDFDLHSEKADNESSVDVEMKRHEMVAV